MKFALFFVAFAAIAMILTAMDMKRMPTEGVAYGED